ncbi:hypothetical protein D3C77_536320 [compost metagenome]
MYDRARNLREAPIRIRKDRNGNVLNFRIAMRGVADYGLHALRHAHHPLQHVQMMNAMIKRAAASLAFPGSPPPEIVVVFTTPPVGIHLRMNDFS